MKKKIIFLLTFIIAIIPTYADFGVKLGFTSSNFKFSHFPATEWDSINNIQAGIFYNLPISKKLQIQPELFYSSSGASTNTLLWDSPIKIIENIHYIKLPILLKYSFFNNNKFHTGIFIGPYFASTLNSNTRVTYEGMDSEEEITDKIREQDYGYIWGVFFNFKRLTFDLRLSSGIVNLSPTFSEYHVKNRAMTFLIGYKF